MPEFSASPAPPCGFAAHGAAWALRALFDVTLRRPSIGQKLLISFGWRLKSLHAKCVSTATQPMQRYCAPPEAPLRHPILPRTWNFACTVPRAVTGSAVVRRRELQASVRPKCGLTLRSRRGPTALHQARAAPRHIMHRAGLVQCRRPASTQTLGVTNPPRSTIHMSTH